MARGGRCGENGERGPWVRCMLEVILIGIADGGEGRGGIRIPALNHRVLGKLEPHLDLILV